VKARVEIRTSALPPLQAHEHRSGIPEKASEVWKMPGGDRLPGKRFRDTIVVEGASKLKFPGLLFDSPMTLYAIFYSIFSFSESINRLTVPDRLW
jgi:hypothetical protein